VWKFEERSQIGETPQTKCSFASVVDIGGAVPDIVMNAQIKKFARTLIHLNKRFARSDQIDSTQRSLIAKEIEALTPTEDSAYMFTEEFKDVKGKVKIDNTLALTDSWLNIEGKGEGWGSTTVKVRASMEEVAAFFWDFESRVNKHSTGDIERSVEERMGPWSTLRKGGKLCSQSTAQSIATESFGTQRLSTRSMKISL
jgi:hypothetical protein